MKSNNFIECHDAGTAFMNVNDVEDEKLVEYCEPHEVISVIFYGIFLENNG